MFTVGDNTLYLLTRAHIVNVLQMYTNKNE